MSPAGTSVSAPMCFEKLCHKALAKAHNLSVGFTLGVKIGTALAAAYRKTCERVFEYLLKPQEFDNAFVNRRMETKTAFVRTDCAVKLHTEATVDLHLTVIINPRNTELDDALGSTIESTTPLSMYSG